MAVTDATKDCTEFDSDLHDLLLGEIDSAAKVRTESHLSGCPSCRIALEEARRGLLGLEALTEAPLPYDENEVFASPTSDHRQKNWLAFKQRVQEPAPAGGDLWGIRLLSAAAILILGIGLGVQIGTRRESPRITAEIADTKVEPETIASLARIELLADVGQGYTRGLRDLLGHMASLEADDATPAELEATREIARDLVRDGRLLRRTLDPERDQTLLAAVNRAELVLEEIAAVGASGLGAPSSSVRLAVNDDVLRSQLTSVKFDRAPDRKEGSPKRPTSSLPREKGTSP